VGREDQAGKAGARSTASKVKGRRERRLKDDAIRARLRCGAPRRVLFFRVTAVFFGGAEAPAFRSAWCGRVVIVARGG